MDIVCNVLYFLLLKVKVDMIGMFWFGDVDILKVEEVKMEK